MCGLIFILGGEGFVGSAFVRHCNSMGIPHESVTRQNYSEHAGSSCDVLVASNASSDRRLCGRDPRLGYDLNVTAIQRALCDFDYGRFVLVSSCDVYPDCSSYDATAETAGIDVSLQGTYGFYKYVAERLVMHHADDWLIARLGGMVGSGLVKNPIYDVLHGGPLYVDPLSRLQFINTDDVARIALGIQDRNEIFNICGRGQVRLADVLERYGPADVEPGSPEVAYDVNTDKISRIADLPSTADTVAAYCDPACPGGVDRAC